MAGNGLPPNFPWVNFPMGNINPPGAGGLNPFWAGNPMGNNTQMNGFNFPALPTPLPHPHPRRNDIVVCAVCGGICKPTVNSAIQFHGPLKKDWMHPMLIKAKSEYNEWRKLPFTAKAYNRVDNKLFIEMEVASFEGGADGFRVRGRGRVAVNTSDSEMAIPIHPFCLEISKVFCRYQSRFDIDFRSAAGGAPSSLAHLYEIWCKRAIAICANGVMTKPIRDPHDYFGAACVKDLEVYTELIEVDQSLRHYEADPFNIPSFTQIVISNNLQPMVTPITTPTTELAECWTLMQGMPQEVHDRIIAALEPFEDGFQKEWLTPTRLVPSSWWKKKLMDGELIPWLFGLDDASLKEDRLKQGMSPDQINDEDIWDWELLCRSLAQPDAFKEGGILHDVSTQLWNRRRIWRVLYKARLGHMVFELPD